MSATVQFLTNEKGRKTAVVLPIDDYEKLLEDLDDLAVIAERRGEETIPHAEFKKGLKRHALSGMLMRAACQGSAMLRLE
jgi:hypothetical protein